MSIVTVTFWVPVPFHPATIVPRRDLLAEGEDERVALLRLPGRRPGDAGLDVGRRRGGVVDDAVRDHRRVGGVAGVVGRDGAKVVTAVGDAGRVPRAGVRARGVGADRRPRGSPGRGALDGDVEDARAAVSVPVAFSVTVRRSGEPGSVSDAVGAVLSTRRFATVEEVVCVPRVVRGDRAKVVEAVVTPRSSPTSRSTATWCRCRGRSRCPRPQESAGSSRSRRPSRRLCRSRRP